MADERSIGADEVARKQFATAFRGFDQYEVRAFLAQVAAALASTAEREKALRERLATLEEQRPARAVPEDELEAALGVETTRVLHAAREAATEIRARAEESVARMVRETNDETARLRHEAESLLARRSDEAESAAAAIRTAAESAAAALRAEAEANAAATIEEAQQRGREMVGEAQTVRERVVRDLNRRRKAAATQLEQLLAGRERLLSAYEVVRGTLDEVTHELAVAEGEARLAAEVAGFRRPPEEEPPVVDDEPAPMPAPTPESEPEPVVRPVAIVPPLPEPPEAAEVGDDRRSSSLRLLRRRPEVPEAPPVPDDDIEGVRIIRPEPAAEPPPVPEAPPVPEPAPLPEPEPEPVAPRPLAVPDPTVVAEEPFEEPSEEPVAAPVDDLFARLRADRAAAVAHAEEVLAAPEPELEAKPEADLEPAADAVFEQRDAAIEPAERALTRALKRTLADEQNEVLDALRRRRGAARLDQVLPGLDEHVKRFASVAGEHLTVGAVAGAASLGGPPPDVGELAIALGSELAEDLRARVERALDASGTDDEALVDAISATYREWKSARIEPFARHHVAAAFALGAYAAASFDDLRWVVDTAEGACPDCDDNALAGPTRKGEVYPTGQVHPPAHAGCRCLVLPAS